MRNILLLLIVSYTVCSCSSLEAEYKPKLTTVGWLEQIVLSPPGILLHAKIDTGADNCSIHAHDIEYLTENVGGENESWVRFKISNRYGREVQVARKILRTAKIKTKDGGAQKRPVVRFGVCLGNNFESIECNLVDRSHFAYPALIGRNYLAGSLLVNSSNTYTIKPRCGK